MEKKDTSGLDFGALDLTPDWAKQAAGVNWSKVEEPRAKVEGRRSEGQRSKAEGQRSKAEGQRSEGRRFEGRRNDRQPSSGIQARSNRPRPLNRPVVKPAEVDVRVLPDQKALGTVMRKIQSSMQAFKLKDLAHFLLDNPASVLLRVTPKAVTEGEKVRLFQCKACSFVSTSRDKVIEHCLAEHTADYWVEKEIEVEPPKGNFNCVAKCGLSGVFLGPPNVHDFNSCVRAVWREKYPGMSEAEYRSHIMMLRDSESIEAWRAQATKKTVYLPKGSEDAAEAKTRDQVENEMRRNIIENMVDEPKSVFVRGDVALKLEERPLLWALRDALQLERRTAQGMIFALRGAFHNRKMNFFRVNDSRGSEFVVGHELKEFDTAHAIKELADMAEYIKAHPCSMREELVKDAESEKQLTWLVSTGHVVAFSNGAYSAVEKYPKYGPEYRAKSEGQKVEETAAPVEEPANADDAQQATEEKKEES